MPKGWVAPVGWSTRWEEEEMEGWWGRLRGRRERWAQRTVWKKDIMTSFREKCHCVYACRTTLTDLSPKMQNLNGLIKCHRVRLTNQPHVTLTYGWCSHFKSSLWPFLVLLLSHELAQVHFFPDVSHAMTKTWALIPSPSSSTVIAAGPWKAEVVISGQGNFPFCR